MEKKVKIKPLQLNDTAPNFTAETTEGHINFYDFIGHSWCLFFSHAKDFSSVCTTELGAVAKMKSEMDKRNVKVLALSFDDSRSHNDWICDINQTQGVRVNFPIISDENREIAKVYGMIHPNVDQNHPIRSLYLIDSQKKIRLIMMYPPTTGRNFHEVLRVVDSLRLADQCDVATPANWQEGEDCIILSSAANSDEMEEKFPQGWSELTPYLRITPQPKNPSELS